MSSRLQVDLADDSRLAYLAPCEAPDWTISVSLHNVSATPRVFKCKTTAPRRWSVRPNGGVLNPGEVVEVSIRIINRGSTDAIADDQHLILHAPVSPDAAVLLRQQRKSNPGAPPTEPRSDAPGVGELRLTPTFASLPALADDTQSPAQHSLAGSVDADDARAAAKRQQAFMSPSAMSSAMSIQTDRSPMSSPEIAPASLSGPRSSVVDEQHRGSVAERVAELDRKYGHTANRHVPNGGAHDGESESEGEGSSRGHGGNSSLAITVLRTLERLLDEFSPWLSWKVYDILFALFLLFLGRRVRWVREAQELLNL